MRLIEAVRTTTEIDSLGNLVKLWILPEKCIEKHTVEFQSFCSQRPHPPSSSVNFLRSSGYEPLRKTSGLLNYTPHITNDLLWSGVCCAFSNGHFWKSPLALPNLVFFCI